MVEALASFCCIWNDLSSHTWSTSSKENGNERSPHPSIYYKGQKYVI